MPKEVYEKTGVKSISELEPEIIKALNSDSFKNELLSNIKKSLISAGK